MCQPAAASDDPAVYLASRIRAACGEPITTATLARACRDRGALLVPGTSARCVSVSDAGAILVPQRCSPRALAHELWHFLAADAERFGVDYSPPHWRATQPEEAAERFAAALLCRGPADCDG